MMTGHFQITAMRLMSLLENFGKCIAVPFTKTHKTKKKIKTIFEKKF